MKKVKSAGLLYGTKQEGGTVLPELTRLKLAILFLNSTWIELYHYC